MLIDRETKRELKTGDKVWLAGGESAILYGIVPENNRVLLKIQGATKPASFFPEHINADFCKQEEVRLIDRETKQQVNVGDTVYTFRGEECVLTCVAPKINRIYLREEGITSPQEYYPQVIGADWD